MDSFVRLAAPVSESSWGGILLFVGADLEYICTAVGLPHYNSAENMCMVCLANTGDIPHNTVHTDAAWMGTLLDKAGCLARIRRPMHDLAAHEVFNRFTYRFDLLHMCDHHGVASHVIGNVLWAHISSDREWAAIPGDTVGKRLRF